MNKALKTSLWVVGIGGIAYALYRFYKKQILLLENYDNQIIGVKYREISKTEVVFDIKMRFINKSKFEVIIKKIYFDVYIGGIKVGFMNENKEFFIPAEGSSDIDLQITINPQFALKNIVGIILVGIKQKEFRLVIDGYADVRSSFIRVTIPVKYSDKIRF